MLLLLLLELLLALSVCFFSSFHFFLLKTLCKLLCVDVYKYMLLRFYIHTHSLDLKHTHIQDLSPENEVVAGWSASGLQLLAAAFF